MLVIDRCARGLSVSVVNIPSEITAANCFPLRILVGESVHTCIYMHANIYTHAYIHTHTYTPTHTHRT